MGSSGSSYSLRILCFGDSLTEGYTQSGQVWAPYSSAFKARLEQSGRKVDVVTDGLSGDQVTAGSFGRRMTIRFDVPSTRFPLYDWVLLLGGTNDLGWGKPTSVIHDALVGISNIPLNKGAKVLFFTVPECQYKQAALDARRDELNQWIKQDGRENVFAFDLHSAIPYHALDAQERKKIWDDGLHLTSKGYERLGQLAADRLIELIDAEENVQKQ